MQMYTHQSLYGPVFSFLLGKDLAIELVGHRARECLKDSDKIFFKVVVQFYTPAISNCSTSLSTLGIASLFNLANLMGVKCSHCGCYSHFLDN